MRSRVFLETTAWVAGAALVGFYVNERASFERERAAAVASFRAEHAPAEQTGPIAEPAASSSAPRAIDFATWSSARVAAYAAISADAAAPAALLTIPALDLTVPIYSDTSEDALNRGAGHIEGTAALGSAGNTGIAAHRDGFFRKLEDAAIGDEVLLETGDRVLRYRVAGLDIVSPSATSVLAPTAAPALTLVTCYPFYFVGAAPERYVVRAELVDVPAPAGARLFEVGRTTRGEGRWGFE